MPIYEYQCSECGQKKEALQKLSDAPLKDCPACGKPTLTKLISAAGFQLKGSGWYVTDFRGGKSGKPDSEKSGGKATTEAKSGDGDKSGGDKSAESKPTETKSADTKTTESAKPAAASSSAAPAPASKAS